MSIEHNFINSEDLSLTEQREILAPSVQKAEEKDLPRIFEIEKRSYSPQLQATHEILRQRFYDMGIWVAETNGTISGFFTCVPADLPLSDLSPENIEKIVDKVKQNRHPKYKPWFEEYKTGGRFNTLWVTSTAVETKYQGKGVGTALIKYSLDLAKELGLCYRASALRCQYARFFQETGESIEDYIQQAEGRKIEDRFLYPYLNLGFKLVVPLPDYEPHEGSMNYNLLAIKEIQ